MKLLYELEKDIIDSNIDLTQILRKAQVLAYKLKVSDMKTWVDNELNGYKGTNNLPDYRILPAKLKGNFESVEYLTAGTMIKNIEIPLTKEDLEKDYGTVKLLQSVSTYEDILKRKTERLCRMLPANMAMVSFNNIFDKYEGREVWQEFSSSTLKACLDKVRNKLLQLVLELQDQYQELKSPEEKIDVQTAQTIFNHIVNIHSGDNSTIISGSTDVKVHQVQANDFESLKRFMESINIPQEDINALQDAVETDVAEKNGPKNNVLKWTSNISQKILDGTITAATGTAVPLIMKAISKFYE